jgi:AraC-like DNA-binding protein
VPGVTPAKLIERLRVEHGRTLLSSTELSQKLVAGQAGFSGSSQMQRAFKRHLGVDAGAVRLLFKAGSGGRRPAARVAALPAAASMRDRRPSVSDS